MFPWPGSRYRIHWNAKRQSRFISRRTINDYGCIRIKCFDVGDTSTGTSILSRVCTQAPDAAAGKVCMLSSFQA